MSKRPLSSGKGFGKTSNNSPKKQKTPSESFRNFKALVDAGNTPELINYFAKQGIEPNMARLNLEMLIQEELRILSAE